MTGKAIGPFAHLNLRRNPFGELPDGVRGQLAVVDVAALSRWLRHEGRALEFVGESGRGKSTHLLALEEALDAGEYLRVRRDESRPEIPEADPKLVDEIQFLPRSRRRELYGRTARLAVGTHARLRSELRRAGFEVRTCHVGRVSVERLDAIVRRRIDWARRGEGPVPEVAPETIEALRERYGTDIRAVEHHLYEVFQKLEVPRRVKVDDLIACSGNKRRKRKGGSTHE